MRCSVGLPTTRVDVPEEFLSGRAIAEMASAAEQLGFDAVYVTDHPAGDQKWLETGTFSDLVGANNFSGIGGCPTCPHDAFKTARDGVRAQIELLRWHADARLKSAKDFASQPTTLPARFFRTGHISPTWYRLGGVWSPDPTYGLHVYAIYIRMLDMHMPKVPKATVAS